MVGATVLGVFLQGLPPDRRVAMARVASLIRRAARGVRESKRHGLVFYELNGGPLFALESREKSLALYVAEKGIIGPFVEKIKGFDAEHSLINFTDLNRLPLPDIEKLVRASVLARRERGTAPTESELLTLWGVQQEAATVAPPIVRISLHTKEEDAAAAAAKAEAEQQAAQTILKTIKVTTKSKSGRSKVVKKTIAKKASVVQAEEKAAAKAAAAAKKAKEAAKAKEAKSAGEKTTTEKKPVAKKATVKKASVKKTAAKTSASKKTSTKKSTVKKTAAKEE